MPIEGIRVRCSPEHLQRCHNLRIEPISSITEEVLQLTLAQKNKEKDKPKMVRSKILSYAEELIQPNLNILKKFLSQSQRTM